MRTSKNTMAHLEPHFFTSNKVVGLQKQFLVGFLLFRYLPMKYPSRRPARCSCKAMDVYGVIAALDVYTFQEPGSLACPAVSQTLKSTGPLPTALNKQWVTCQTRNGLEVFVKHVNILDRHMEMMDADNRVLGDS